MIGVLDGGFVDLQDVFGDETTVVNCARVSFGKQKDGGFDEGDRRLLHYLIRNKHFSPFRHVILRFHIRAPEFVMRQWYKHIIGAEWATPAPFHAWNEISGRYVKMEDVHTPSEWRRQSQSAKQGSDGVIADDDECHELYRSAVSTAMDAYNRLIEKGAAREQARLILPFALYTETIWTCSFQALMNFLELRLDTHAQSEIREYARTVMTLLRTRLPILYECWMESSQK